MLSKNAESTTHKFITKHIIINTAIVLAVVAGLLAIFLIGHDITHHKKATPAKYAYFGPQNKPSDYYSYISSNISCSDKPFTHGTGTYHSCTGTIDVKDTRSNTNKHLTLSPVAKFYDKGVAQDATGVQTVPVGGHITIGYSGNKHPVVIYIARS